jgi:Putative prokaryotic signal transducing protein
MSSQITVFRSADETAPEDAANVQQMLADEGIQAAVLDDSAPGIPEGAYEVRVDAANQTRAEQLIAQFPPEAEVEDVDPSEALDQVTVFGAASEMEAMSIHGVLEAGGISAMIVGDSRYPNFPQEVRVAKEHEARAKALIAEALAAGPSAAEEAEKLGEQS